MPSYADTIAYDLVVVFFVAVLMPISVLLLRSRSGPGKVSGAALLALSVLYVGGFEHYRLHAPEARHLRRRRCLVLHERISEARAMHLAHSGCVCRRCTLLSRNSWHLG
jgi:hypothetical protein